MARRLLRLFKTSWGVGRFGGTETRVHCSFLVFVAFLFWVLFPQHRWDWPLPLMLTAGFFLSIVWHELGHVLVARRCGVTSLASSSGRWVVFGS